MSGGLTMPFPEPSARNVEEGIRRHKNDPKAVLVDNALAPIFGLYPTNDVCSQVLLKVAALNSLYSTNIYGIVEVARKIVECNIDDMLLAGDPAIVARIGTVNFAEKERNNYSFATKYCWWHNRSDYPIYDSRVDESLWSYMRQYNFSTNKRRQDLRDFAIFKQTISEFQKKFSLQNFTVRDIDNFLYFASELED